MAVVPREWMQAELAMQKDDSISRLEEVLGARLDEEEQIEDQ
jgi:hypothetical protein